MPFSYVSSSAQRPSVCGRRVAFPMPEMGKSEVLGSDLSQSSLEVALTIELIRMQWPLCCWWCPIACYAHLSPSLRNTPCFDALPPCCCFCFQSWRFHCLFSVGTRSDLSLTEGNCSQSVLRSPSVSCLSPGFHIAVFQCLCVGWDWDLSRPASCLALEASEPQESPKLHW